jgi:hypothetical protein
MLTNDSPIKPAAHTFSSRHARIKGPRAFPPILLLPSPFYYEKLSRAREATKLRRLEIVTLSTARGGDKCIGETTSFRSANPLRVDGQPARVDGISVGTDCNIVGIAAGRTAT